MDYGRLGKSEPGASSTRSLTTEPNPKISKLKLLLILAAIIIAAAAATAAALVLILRNKSNSGDETSLQNRRPSQAMSRACSRTLYQSLCLNSLLDFPGAITASEEDLVHISVNVTLQKFGHALNFASDFTNLDMDTHVRSAYSDCLELLDHSIDLLSQSLAGSADGAAATVTTQDVLTWLSAALTNQDTCTSGLDELDGEVKNQISEKLKNLSEHASNALAIYSSGDFTDIPIQNRRRLLSDETEHFPVWLSRRERRLLDMPVTAINADIIVSKDGNGTYKTITAAIKKVPEYSNRRFIIYVRAGKYEEKNLKVGRKKTNLMFIGDGKGKTVITGRKSIQDNITTFHTASFAATGVGFIARDITFENTAGPSKHQAVALRVGADHSVVYRCDIRGYQDTLYTHSQRQFYRECDIYGTVDFIFGNAAVVLQNCSIHARKPMQLQKNTITAQGRKDPNQNTGISIHDCRIVAEPDLEIAKDAYPTYLGRPWKAYSRTVYMLSYMGDHIHPSGWLEWNETFAFETLYYGEYMNYGPSSGVKERVKWPGFRVITSDAEAKRFTVARFIYGSSWLPSTGVAFLAGLST